MRATRKIVVTEADEQRLRNMLSQYGKGRDAQVAERLETELMDAEVVSADVLPPDVVSMDSVVVYEDDRGRRSQVKLVFPDVVADEPRVSVLAPVGSALLGVAVGETIEWPLPNGRTKKLRVLEIRYQPEAAGKEPVT